MTENIDLNKPPQGIGRSVTPDWTTLNNQSDPFYLKSEKKDVNDSELLLKDRYAVSVVTDFKSTGKSRKELQERLNKTSNKEKGLIRILNYYDKNPGNNRQQLISNVQAEGWYIDPRPNARLKVLYSISCEYVDDLPGIVEGSLGLETAVFKKAINTENFYFPRLVFSIWKRNF